MDSEYVEERLSSMVRMGYQQPPPDYHVIVGTTAVATHDGKKGGSLFGVTQREVD